LSIANQLIRSNHPLPYAPAVGFRTASVFCENPAKIELKECYVCGQMISAQRAVTALGRDVCPQHLTCYRCNTRLDFDVWAIGSAIYCERCFEVVKKSFRCTGCQGLIADTALKELDGYWHKSCFVCQKCRRPFPSNRYCVVEKKPYCMQDAQQIIKEALSK
uniref:LIM zinc-binding domain-containing protein n=1 Tax=Soboliphyme baturini TaxID=241478 RepID=A0A183J032_9BILA